MKLDGAVAVVLGGARGIGKAYCISLLERKAKIVCSDLLDDEGKQTETELQHKYGVDHVIYRRCDGASDEQIRELLIFTKTHFGRLDVVVNNVGIVHEKDWQLMLNINVGTAIRVTHAALELLGKDKGGEGGVIVHTASNAGLVPAFFVPIYSATKAAMIAYTRAWAHQRNYMTHGVRMFTMCPTMTNTPFLSQNVDPNRVVQLDEILKMFNLPSPGQEATQDNSKLLRPEWVGEAMARGVEDDDVNGVAVQLLSRDPIYHFAGSNNTVTTPPVDK